MKIALGADHAGYELKAHVKGLAESLGHQVQDFGTNGPEPVDYPDYAKKVADAVKDGRAERGIVVCGSGIGACIAANKVRGVRAALCHDTYSARQGVDHDDVNVLCLGARVIGPALAEEVVKTWLSARFSKEARHLRRLDKIAALEKESRS